MIRFAIEKLSTAKVFIQRILAGVSASRKFSLIKSAAAASAVLPALNEMWDNSTNIIKDKADNGIETWTCGWCNVVKCHLNPTKVLTHVAKVCNPNAHISACTAQIPVVHLQRCRDLFNAKQKKKNAKNKAKKQINDGTTNNIEKVTKTRLEAKRGNDEVIELLGEGEEKKPAKKTRWRGCRCLAKQRCKHAPTTN